MLAIRLHIALKLLPVPRRGAFCGVALTAGKPVNDV